MGNRAGLLDFLPTASGTLRQLWTSDRAIHFVSSPAGRQKIMMHWGNLDGTVRV